MIFLKRLTKQLSTLVALTLILTVFQPVQTLSVHAQEAVTWPIYHEIVLDEARGWIYGSDNVGNKIDVISMTSLQLVKSYTLANGASPRGIALSPDGEELAVAQNGLGTILFIDPDKKQGQGEVIATLPSTAMYQQPWKVIYGRTGRLYTSDNVMNSAIRVVDTTTHTVIASSLASFYGCVDLALSADKNTLYANQALTSNPTLYKLDVSTDDPTVLTYTNHSSDYDGGKFILDNTEKYLFTSYGQVWPSDLTRQVGVTRLAGSLTAIPNHDDTVAMTAPIGFVSFVETTNFYTISTYPLSGSVFGPLVSNAGGSRIFVSTSNGIQVIDLAIFPPGTPVSLPAGDLPYEDLILDETRGVMYGSNTTGHKVDVISMLTLQVVDEIRFKNGASPKGMDLRADGNELAVALNGLSQIVFIDINTFQTVAYVVPDVTTGPNRPFDVKYGRSGRLYASGSPGSLGLDSIHIIDTDNYVELGKSSFVIREVPYLSISADKNTLFVNEQFSPNKLYKFDVQTDSLANPQSTPHLSGLSANTYILAQDQNRFLTSSGQVWSNPTDWNTIQKTGQFDLYNVDLVELPTLNLVAAMGTPGAVSFVNTDPADPKYNIISTIPIPDVSLMGPGVADSTDTNLYLNTEDGILLMILDPALPAELEIQGETSQMAFINTLFPNQITVRALNYLGQPVQGVTVKFQVLPNGASATFATNSSVKASAITDINGVAAAPRLVANNGEGSYNVKAYVDGVLSYAQYKMSNLSTIPLDPSFDRDINGSSKWHTYSTNYMNILCTLEICGNTKGTTGPHSSNYWVRLGGTKITETASVSQYLAIPPMKNLKLRFYLWIGEAGKWSNTSDAFAVKLGDKTIFTANATQISSYSTYTPVVVDINENSSFIQLAFTSTTAGKVVNFNLDDAQIYSAVFRDVFPENWAKNFIERLYYSKITGGCSSSPLLYCPDAYVNRAQMAVFLLRGEHGATYNPDAASGLVFGDVSSAYWAAAWIEQLEAEGITGGCGEGNYCPENTVTRDQMAVFLLRAKHGSDYTPPAATGIFSDVPVSYWAAPWIEQLAAEGITGGCGSGNYCPSQPVTRAQMAVFLVKTFNLP